MRPGLLILGITMLLVGIGATVTPAILDSVAENDYNSSFSGPTMSAVELDDQPYDEAGFVAGDEVILDAEYVWGSSQKEYFETVYDLVLGETVTAESTGETLYIGIFSDEPGTPLEDCFGQSGCAFFLSRDPISSDDRQQLVYEPIVSDCQININNNGWEPCYDSDEPTMVIEQKDSLSTRPAAADFGLYAGGGLLIAIGVIVAIVALLPSGGQGGIRPPMQGQMGWGGSQQGQQPQYGQPQQYGQQQSNQQEQFGGGPF